MNARINEYMNIAKCQMDLLLEENEEFGHGSWFEDIDEV